ncbi:hypothetical protein, partial [Pseudomonas cedrina]
MAEKELRQEISLPAAKQEVGASLLAKHSKKTRPSRMGAFSLATFASKLAPMYGLAPTFNPLFKHWYPVAS